MNKPPKDFMGNVQDWKAIQEINSSEWSLYLIEGICDFFDEHTNKLKNLPDGEVMNMNIGEENKRYDMGYDNNLDLYIWNEKWIKV